MSRQNWSRNCSRCGLHFFKDKWEVLCALQEGRTKGTDGTKGDAGSTMATQCNYCLVACAMCLNNDKAVIEQAIKKLPDSRNGLRMKTPIDFALSLAKETGNDANSPLLDERTREACKSLNAAIHDFVLHNSEKGSAYMAKHQGCSPYDYICDAMSPEMITSVVNTCSAEMMEVRGLHDVKERCQCSKDCKHLLPLHEEDRSALPFLIQGEVVQVTKCCLYSLILNNSSLFPETLAKEVKSLQGCMKSFDLNFPKGPSVSQLCSEGDTKRLEVYIGRNIEDLGDMLPIKAKLGFNVPLGKKKRKSKNRVGYTSRVTKEEHLANKRAVNQSWMASEKYNNPLATVVRNMRNRRSSVMCNRNSSKSFNSFLSFQVMELFNNFFL